MMITPEKYLANIWNLLPLGIQAHIIRLHPQGLDPVFAALRAAQTWPTIDSAPRDGSDVVLVGTLPGDARVRSCVSRWWFDPSSFPYVEGWLYSAPGYQDRFIATHWMPKPGDDRRIAADPQPLTSTGEQKR